jgi:hypothetical protein
MERPTHMKMAYILSLLHDVIGKAKCRTKFLSENMKKRYIRKLMWKDFIRSNLTEIGLASNSSEYN